MSAPKVIQVWLVSLLLVSAAGLVALSAPQLARAQRDDSPSSCCACHTWEDPVVEQGEWHTIHALQMNCRACHGGNDQASDQKTAHMGLVSHPLNSPYLSCHQCHPVDYQQRTAGVAVALGHASSESKPTPFRGWDWPVELAVAIVVLGLSVMRWHRVHSS